MTPTIAQKVHNGLKEPLRDDDLPTEEPNRDSVQYAEKGVTEDLHLAFARTGISYDPDKNCFTAESEDLYDEAALFDCQRAFADALEEFQKGVESKYKSQIDLYVLFGASASFLYGYLSASQIIVFSCAKTSLSS